MLVTTVADDYPAQRLAIGRTQIEGLNRLFLATADPQRLNWLANAMCRLAELERVLAGRPTPGTRPPSSAQPPACRLD